MPAHEAKVGTIYWDDLTDCPCCIVCQQRYLRFNARSLCEVCRSLPVQQLDAIWKARHGQLHDAPWYAIPAEFWPSSPRVPSAPATVTLREVLPLPF